MPGIQANRSAHAGDLAETYARVRALSEDLVEPLSEADATLQSMEDASPAKWHLAHVTWFWETFLLRDYGDGYALFNLRAGFRDDALDIYAWVRNAFDEQYFELLQVAPSNVGLIAGQPGDPRTWGVTAALTF